MKNNIFVLKKNSRDSNNRGFTLVELLVTFTLLAFCLCGVLLTYINMLLFSDLSRDLTLVTNAMQAEMERIKRTSFDSIVNGNFEVQGFDSDDAEGVIEVTNTLYSDQKLVRIVVCFRSRNRVVGEDKDLDGILDTGEDMPPYEGRIDSPAEMVTLVSR